MELYANMHTHSTHSDGGFAPRDVVRICKEEGYKAVSVTDHDIATAWPEMIAACKEFDMDYVLGAEFSSPSDLLWDFYNQNEPHFHIVGYHFDPEYPAMKQYLIDMGIRETEQTHVLFDRGVKMGLLKGITWDEVLEYNGDIRWLCNMHLWRCMLDKGLLKKEDRPWFWKELFAEHRSEVPPHREFKKESEIIQLIRDAGGIAILAHPHEQLKHIDALIEMGVEGLEVWHGMMTDEEREQAVKIAYAKDLYISGGSDHRGSCDGISMMQINATKPDYKPLERLGTTKMHFEEIRDRKLNRW